MSKPKTRLLDPASAAAQFKADLEAMHVGPKDGGNPQKKRMHPKNFGLAEFKRRRWRGQLDQHQSLEDATDPRFWVDQAAQIMGHDKLRPLGRGDIIEIFKPDTGLYAELLIVEVGTGYVRVKADRIIEPDSVPVPETSALDTRWNASANAHEVIRKADGQVMVGGFQTKTAAVEWITKHMNMTAAAA